MSFQRSSSLTAAPCHCSLHLIISNLGVGGLFGWKALPLSQIPPSTRLPFILAAFQEAACSFAGVITEVLTTLTAFCNSPTARCFFSLWLSPGNILPFILSVVLCKGVVIFLIEGEFGSLALVKSRLPGHFCFPDRTSGPVVASWL